MAKLRRPESSVNPSVAKRIAIRLTPKASCDRVGEAKRLPDGSEQLAVYVTAPADKGKANEAMIRLLAKHFGIAPSRIALIHGQTNRNKLVEIGP